MSTLSILTQSQIQVPVDSNPLLDMTADCLRFVTQFFDVIRQSAPHVYHSALLLAPQSSVVRKLYGNQISSAARVVNGIPSSWDSRAVTYKTTNEVSCVAWSQCGQFIALSSDSVEIRDSTTL